MDSSRLPRSLGAHGLAAVGRLIVHKGGRLLGRNASILRDGEADVLLHGNAVSYNNAQGTTGNKTILSRRIDSLNAFNYSACAQGKWPQPVARGVKFYQPSRRCTTAGPPEEAPDVQQASQSRKVLARIANFPKFLSKDDLLWIFRECNVTKEDIVYVYDQKYRLRFIQLNLASTEIYRSVHRALSLKGRYGGRYLRLTMEGSELDFLNKNSLRFRGRTLMMVKTNLPAVTEDVERFFSGYALDCNNPIKFVRSTMQGPAGNDSAAAEKAEADSRVLVRFKTELEALRALRERQGAHCLDRPAELRLIQ